ncbi:MAG: alpha-mannosidase [Acidimicrobiales bacterium]
MTPRTVAIVPHTHWDREWYEPYQSFRMKLVDTLDGLLDLMEADPSYTCFLVDGQLAAVDDYLEIRPEHEGRVRALAAAGRLTMGPWYILMDEFLVSGETLVRDLQMGLARAAAFGGAMEVGYLPDMFGHVAQMPQILRLAGLEHAVVWRGVPSTVTKTGFWWEAPDGSTVRAEYLPVGYGNGAVLPDDAKALVRRTEDNEQELAPFLLDGLLMMNGSDHLPPQPWLGRVVAEANALQDDYRYEITSLPAYLATAPTEGLERWRGELRSGARANVLMGVTSNRVDVKRAAAAAERQLERRAEPYAALYLPADRWPARVLALGWLGVVRNAAHDSVCACSVDDVVDAVLHRYAESRQIGEEVAARALTALGRSMAEPGPVVVNPSARPRSGVVELVVGADEPPGPHVQVVSERFGLPGSMTMDAETVRTILGMLQGPKIDNDAWVQDVRIEEDDSGIDLTVVVGPEERPNVPIAEAKRDMYALLGARPDVQVRVRLDQPPIRRVAARVAAVPGFGWHAFEPTVLAHPATVEGPDGDGAVVLGNGLVTVAVDPADGTFSLDGVGGYGRLVDGGDLGDSYNYSPPGGDSLVDAPESVVLAVGERGPVRASAVITATYRWPDHVDGRSQARVGSHEVEVTTVVEVRADERPVRVTTSFVNPSRDHRLRLHLPLPRPATTSEAECAFGTVTRGLVAEGRPDELGLPTFPARRFVEAGGLTVVHDGVTEYELVDVDDGGNVDGNGGGGARAIALTLLRSTGMLSRVGMAYRPFPAGPLTAVDGLQLAGRRVEARYALAVGDVDPWAMADDVLLPLDVVGALGGGDRPAAGSALTVEGAEVTAVRREGTLLEIRVCNPADEPAAVRTAGRSGWLVDLRGRPIEAFDGGFELRPRGIATFRLAAG